MPRPGPRPYECVRRAWHSDRHQPIRGSVIQEIFRIANEIHTAATKKNKEWQEKLPIVVLKAEEIMYSKANSEAEYMDLKTLWDRANDAINTIIRRGEGSEETGEFLQPCIEAALHLGCIPRRVSRSQRNNHPKGYLTGSVDLERATEGHHKTTSSPPPQYSKLLGKESHKFVVSTNSCITSEMPFLYHQNCLPVNGSFPTKSYPVYPLYYGAYTQPIESHLKLGGTPTSVSMSKDCPAMGIPQEVFLFKEESRMSRGNSSEVLNSPPSDECDLSLHLGIATVQEGVNAGSNHSRDKSNFVGSRQEPKERLSLYFENIANSDSEVLDVGLMVRKQKAGEPMMDKQHSWHPKLMSAYSSGGTRTAGL